MDYIQGRTLEQLIADQPLSEADMHTYNRALCAVLHYLHTQTPPIIFRDLKPSNVMASDDGQLKLIDFGIAKSLDVRTCSRHRDQRPGAGTPGFAAPEQYAPVRTPAPTSIRWGRRCIAC